MKKEIYLDFNVLISIVKKEVDSDYTFAKIANLKRNGFIFPYSPAHIEEIAVNYGKYCKSEADEVVNKRLRLVKWTSQCFEYLPGTPSYESVIKTLKEVSNDPSLIKIKGYFLIMKRGYENGSTTAVDNATQLRKEEPAKCMARVMKDIDLTQVAQDNDMFHVGRRTKNSLKSNFEILGKSTEGLITFEEVHKKMKLGPRRLNRIPYDEIFSHSNFLKLLSEDFKNSGMNLESLKKGEHLMNDHSERESAMNVIFGSLERAGYYQEKSNSETKIRSRMHDVTHAIYGCESECFVTNDARFRQKLKAVLHFLNIPCNILSLDEFLIFRFHGNEHEIVYV